MKLNSVFTTLCGGCIPSHLKKNETKNKNGYESRASVSEGNVQEDSIQRKPEVQNHMTKTARRINL